MFRPWLTLEEIDLLLPEIAAALEHAHGHGLFHGDLKPTDLLLDHAGHAFVADLGLAAALGRTGSPYQAPELRRGSACDRVAMSTAWASSSTNF